MSPAPPFSPPPPQENQRNSPTRNKSAVFAVPRVEGPHPVWSHPSLSTLDLKRDPSQCPWTAPGWKWARQTQALPMHPGHRRAEPDTGRFSELNGGPLFLAAHSILGITGGRSQLRDHRVGWGTAQGTGREKSGPWRVCEGTFPRGPHWGGTCEGTRRLLWAHSALHSCFLLSTVNPAGWHWAP